MTATSAASQRFELIERFTAPGQPFELGERTVRGVPMRVYTTGPQTLREIALAIGAFGDRPFLVMRQLIEDAAAHPEDYASLAAVDVQQHVAQRLASFKVPAHIVFQSAPLPRTQSGKVLKRDLRAAVTAKVRERRNG